MSSKTSIQPGRRTPLSLSGAVTKSQPNKGSPNVANGGINANGHPAPSNNKQDNKLQQQKSDQPTVNNIDAKVNPNKKQQQQPQADKKPQQNESKKSNEKIQSGPSNSNKQETNENKEQLQQENKEKVPHQNGNEEKVSEKEQTEKSEKSEKPKDKSERDIAKSKEDKKREQNMSQNKKDEKKAKESKDTTKEDKMEVSSKSGANAEIQQKIKGDDKSIDLDKYKEKVKSVNKKLEEKEENMANADVQTVQKSSNSATTKNITKANKSLTPVNKTPTKIAEKKTQKGTSTSPGKIVSAYKREETTAIDDNDIEMEPLAIENSPVKQSQHEELGNNKIVPSATSTPGRLLKRYSTVAKSDVPLVMELSPERPKMFSQISGRKSIRPISDYTPSKFQSNLQFRESYRRINTELDVTNSSMNVTVGSEVPSNFSFSFFGRARKRDRTSPSPHSQSAIGELQTDIEISPPKKSRLDIHGILSAVSSPISLLRNRFSKASLQSSTPVKLQQKLITAEDEIEVQNVSGVSVQEEITTPDDTNLTIDDDDATLGEEAKETKLSSPIELHSVGKEIEEEELYEQSDIKNTEAKLQSTVGDQIAKNKRCAVM